MSLAAQHQSSWPSRKWGIEATKRKLKTGFPTRQLTLVALSLALISGTGEMICVICVGHVTEITVFIIEICDPSSTVDLLTNQKGLVLRLQTFLLLSIVRFFRRTVVERKTAFGAILIVGMDIPGLTMTHKTSSGLSCSWFLFCYFLSDRQQSSIALVSWRPKLTEWCSFECQHSQSSSYPLIVCADVSLDRRSCATENSHATETLNTRTIGTLIASILNSNPSDRPWQTSCTHCISHSRQ